MKAWIANLMWDALWICLRRIHDWAFDPDRADLIRAEGRERWWSYHCKAVQTASERDDMRAEFWRRLFNFHDAPEIKAAKRIEENWRPPVPSYPAH